MDDSAQRNIRVYDFQPDGTLRNGRIFGEEPGAKGEGVPDGMRSIEPATFMSPAPEEFGFGILTDIT